ncbi:polysaccharide biosynthesis/export family protein [Leeuwenhoekiella sp. LLG6367-2.1]|uniref:polysaccharide biosynthesis/export family protein n=1 Tax=Leeuwenhoekiella sp. LLG6367-2.1 TaxID=3160833 RepID=UPI00386EB40C
MNLSRFFRLSTFSICCIFFATSCVTRKQVIPFFNLENLPSDLQLPQDNVKIQPDDILTITVFAPLQETATPFNLSTRVNNSGGGGNSSNKETYQVSDEGTIKFPYLGDVYVVGLSQESLSKKLSADLTEFLKDPIVQVRIQNFKVTIMGEVSSPKTIIVEEDFISLPNALSQAGDLKISARRDNILIIREENNKLTYNYLDIRDNSLFSSPFYYLQQNDIVYVEPNTASIQKGGYLSTISTYLGLTSVIISLALIFTR